MTPHPALTRGAALYCAACRSEARSRVVVEDVHDGRGRKLRAKPVAIEAECRCGARERVDLRGSRR